MPKSPGDPLADQSNSLLSNTKCPTVSADPRASSGGGKQEKDDIKGRAPSKTEAFPRRITFANQDALPKLPIPDLGSTCKKYLESLLPLQNPREHEETKAAVQDFLRTDGPELQEKLKAYATSKTSYIEQFCECLAHSPLNT